MPNHHPPIPAGVTRTAIPGDLARKAVRFPTDVIDGRAAPAGCRRYRLPNIRALVGHTRALYRS
jgi:hypothetical protein